MNIEVLDVVKIAKAVNRPQDRKYFPVRQAGQHVQILRNDGDGLYVGLYGNLEVSYFMECVLDRTTIISASYIAADFAAGVEE